MKRPENHEKQAGKTEALLPDDILEAVIGGKSECIYKQGYCPFCRTERDLCALTSYGVVHNGISISDGEKCYCKQCYGVFTKVPDPATGQIMYLNEDNGRI